MSAMAPQVRRPIAQHKATQPQARDVTTGAAAQLDTLQQRADAHSVLSPLAALQMRANAATSPIQRSVIAPAQIAGLAANIDTAQFDAAKAQVDTLWNSGQRKTLIALYTALGTAYQIDTHPEQNKALRTHIHGYVSKDAKDDAEHGNANFFTKGVFDLTHGASDKTGIKDGAAPNNPTAEQSAAMGVRAWQAGDVINNINWKTVGLYLQGRLSDAEYGALIVMFPAPAPLPNAVVIPQAQREKAHVDGLIEQVAQSIRDGLNYLPAYVGKSYRAATTAQGIMSSQVTVGDLIKDKSFWSTSALQLDNGGNSFGTEGTQAAPKVYYIIDGSSGVFLPAFTNFEANVREVLFKDETVFRVKKIHNYNEATFFVSIEEVDQATLAPAAAVKNPWTGTVYP